MPHLYDNTSWAAAANTVNSFALTVGPQFGLSAGITVTHLRWYRYRTGGTVTPSNMKLWRKTGAVLLATSPSVPDNGAIGWQEVALATPVALTVGGTYIVTMDVGAGSQSGPIPRADVQPAPSPTLFDDVLTAYKSGSNGFPDTFQNTSGYGVDITYGVTPPPGPGAGDPTLTGDLNSWLSAQSSVNTHQTDGLPWLTKVVADTIKATTDAIKATTDGLAVGVGALSDAASSTGSLLARTARLLQDTAAILSRLPADILTALKTAADATLSWLGAGPKPAGAPTLPVQVADVADQLTSLAGQVSQLAGNVEQLQAPLAGFPTEFELVDEFTFAECVAWNVAADVYVLHITTVPRGRALSDVCGVNIIYRCGWWAPLADTLPAGRLYVDFEFNLISHPAGRLPGILVQLDLEGAGVIQAWNRLPPPIGP